jgi:hypothetical protein
MDRRAMFFVLAAIVCAALIPVTDDDFRWVPLATSIVYVILAIASLLDARSRRRSS